MDGVFITGTDTGVGKTVVSAALVASAPEDLRAVYWKPVQTGIEVDDDTQTVRDLAQCAGDEVHDSGIRLERPLSPHLSARLAGKQIDIDSVLAHRVKSEADDGRFWVVEGAGGLLVPLNEREMIIELIETLGLRVLVVARSTLGTINHTLLTLEALKSREIAITGVVLNGPPNRPNRDAIEHFGGVGVLAELPELPELNRDALSEVFGRSGIWQSLRSVKSR